MEEVHTSLSEEAIMLTCEQGQVSDLTPFLEQVKRTDPDLILIDVGSLRGAISQPLQNIRSAAPKSFLVALNTQADPQTLLDCFHAGANEYLVPPMRDGIRNTLHNRLPQVGRAGTTAGKVVGFLSAKGGCGATTIACHAAVQMAGLNQKVLLADFDLLNGIVGFCMGTQSSYSIVDALRNTDRLDRSYWGALISQGPPGLEIIPAPTSIDSAQGIEQAQVRSVLEYSRKAYGWTVLDLGHGLSPFNMLALDAVDELCLVVRPDIPALHRAKLIVQTLLDSGFARDRLHVILNAVSRRIEVDRVSLERILTVPIFAALKNQEGELGDAWSSGSLLPPKNELTRQIGRLARKLMGEKPEPPRRFSFFRRNR